MVKLTTLKSKLSAAPARLPVVVASDSWRGSKNSTQRGYGYKWQKARAAYLVKHPFCAYCLRDAGIGYAQTAQEIILACDRAGVRLPRAALVDHVVAHEGDDALFWDSANWQSMCTPHHNIEKQRQEREGRVKSLEGLSL